MADGTRRVKLTGAIDEQASVALLYDSPAELDLDYETIMEWIERHPGKVAVIQIDRSDGEPPGLAYYDEENGWDEVPYHEHREGPA